MTPDKVDPLFLRRGERVGLGTALDDAGTGKLMAGDGGGGDDLV